MQGYEPSTQTRISTPPKAMAREDSDTLPVHYLSGGLQTLGLSSPPSQAPQSAATSFQPFINHQPSSSTPMPVFGQLPDDRPSHVHTTIVQDRQRHIEHKCLGSSQDDSFGPPAKRQKSSTPPNIRPPIYTSNTAPLPTHRKANSLPTQPSQGDLRELHASRQQKTQSIQFPLLQTTPPRVSSLANRDDAIWQRPPVPPKDAGPMSILSLSPTKPPPLRSRQHRSPSAPAPVTSTLKLFPATVPLPRSSQSALPTSAIPLSPPPIVFTPTSATFSIPPTPMTANMSFHSSQGSAGSASTDHTTSFFEDWDENSADKAGFVGFMRRSFGRDRSGSNSSSSQKPSSESTTRKRKRGAIFGCFGWNGEDEDELS